MKPPASIFVSHTGGPDDGWTRWVVAILQEFGLNVIVYYGSFSGGGQVAQRVNDALKQSEVCICLFSPRYFEPDRWTLLELNAAIALSKESAITLLPFAIEAVNPAGLYGSLVATELFDYTEAAAIRVISRELHNVGLRVSLVPSAEIPSVRPQYPGLARSPLGIVAVPGAAAVENLIAESERLAHEITTADELSSTHMEELLAATRALARSYNYESPAAILRRTMPHYHFTLEASAGSHSGEQVSELQYVLGRLHAILSYATLDLGSDNVAASHARAVIRCAQNSAHGELAAWGHGTLSMILRFQGHNDTSVAEALRGLKAKVKGSLSARLHAQAALSYVELKDVNQAREHLKKSDDIVDLAPKSPEMKDGIFLFSRAKHHYYAGSAYADFGSAYGAQAVTESEQAVEGFRTGDVDEKSYSDELLAYVHQARGLYAANRLEEIPLALQPLFRTDPKYRTSWHIQWLDRFVAALHSGRSRGSKVAVEVAESTTQFKEELEDKGESDE